MGQSQNLDEPTKFAKYQLTAHLTEGRMGEVYKAKSHGVEGFEKILCIKIIDPSYASQPGFVDTLIEEAKRAVSLSHANVAQVYDLGREEESEKFYIANEYVNGFDLGRALQISRSTDHQWPRDLSIYIASEAAKGIDYAHRRKDFNFNNLNLMHRDVAPSNILISFDGEVKMTDFGISRAMEAIPPEREDQPDRRYMYAAPEQARGEGYTRQSDIYSLGIILYEMLTGLHPYREYNGSIREAAVTADYPPLAEVIDVPQELQRIVDSMLVPDPAGRVGAAGSVYEELIGYLFGNNLRADNRALSLLMEEMRKAESEVSADERPREAGLEQISKDDVENFYDRSSATLSPPIDRLRDMREAQEEIQQDPTAELDPSILEDEPSEPLPDLPGGLEECFESARNGQGKAVLMSGHFGRGPQYLPDRISEVLGWRGNTRVFSIQATPDDVYRPLGVICDLVAGHFGEGSPDARPTRRRARQALEQLDISEVALETIAGLWGLEETPQLGYEQRRDRLSDLFAAVLGALAHEGDGPVVLVIDHVERVDGLTVDVLRNVVSQIDRLPVMLVFATSADELMRAAFDVGRPESLKAIRVSAPESADLGGIPDLSDDASTVLLTLALAEQPFTSTALSEILDISIDRIDRAAEELSDESLVRTPGTDTLMSGVSEASVWVKQRFDRSAIEGHARALCRYFSQKLPRGEPDLKSPTLVRLLATACERRRMLNLADNFSDWLERNSWLDVALDFYEYCGDLMAQESVGSPQARIAYLLSRAELALDLSRLDEARSSLEPLRALSETVRNEQGFVRSQLLLGRMAMQQDDLDKAHGHFQRATDVARGLREPQLLTRSLLALAGWATRFGDVVEAQTYLEGAMNLSSRWGTFRLDLNSRSVLLYRAVRIFAERGMHRRAFSFLEDLESLADSSGLGTVECRAALGRAEIFARRGEFDEALEVIGQTQQVASRIGLTALTITLTRRRAALALEAGRNELVVTLADEVIDLSTTHDDLYSEQRGRDLKATACALLDENRQEALKHLYASLDRADGRNVPRDIYRCHRNLARALEEENAQQAAEHREKADELADRMRYSSAAA